MSLGLSGSLCRSGPLLGLGLSSRFAGHLRLRGFAIGCDLRRRFFSCGLGPHRLTRTIAARGVRLGTLPIGLGLPLIDLRLALNLLALLANSWLRLANLHRCAPHDDTLLLIAPRVLSLRRVGRERENKSVRNDQSNKSHDSAENPTKRGPTHKNSIRQPALQ